MNRPLRYLLWTLTVAYMLAIYYLSSASDIGASIPLENGLDKILHAVEYAGLAMLWHASLRATAYHWNRNQCASLAFAVASMYALSDELHQSYVPLRTSSVYDLAADVAGALVVLMIFTGFLWKREHIHHRRRA